MNGSRRRRRVTYRPNKTQGIIGGAVGLVFVLIGLTIVIPNIGLFGIFWTVIAAIIAITNFYQAFGKTYLGPEIHIEDEEGGDERAEEPETGGSAEARLTELRALYDRRLITEEEYESKRREILKEL